jgi:hypothetical protein
MELIGTYFNKFPSDIKFPDKLEKYIININSINEYCVGNPVEYNNCKVIITNRHFITYLDPDKIYMVNNMEKIKLKIYKCFNWTDIVLLQCEDDNDNDKFDYKLINQRLAIKFPKLKCFILISGNRVLIDHVGHVHSPLWDIKSYPPNQIYILFKLTEKNIDLQSLSGTFIFNENNKIVGILTKYDPLKNIIYCLPSIYIQKIFNEIDFPETHSKVPFIPLNVDPKTFNVLEKYGNFNVGDKLIKVNGKKINSKWCIYSNEIHEWITFHSYLLLFTKYGDEINIDVKSNDKLISKPVIVDDLTKCHFIDIDLKLKVQIDDDIVNISVNKFFVEYLEKVMNYDCSTLYKLINTRHFDNINKIKVYEKGYNLFKFLKNDEDFRARLQTHSL